MEICAAINNLGEVLMNIFVKTSDESQESNPMRGLSNHIRLVGSAQVALPSVSLSKPINIAIYPDYTTFCKKGYVYFKSQLQLCRNLNSLHSDIYFFSAEL